jgi:hypothetical protein
MPLQQKLKNNPMHSRARSAGQRSDRSLKPLPRRANHEQTGKGRGLCAALSFSQSDAPSAGLESQSHTFRIFRITA